MWCLVCVLEDSLVYFRIYIIVSSKPKSGTASEVAGIVSATILRKTVNESKIVTPKKDPIS